MDQCIITGNLNFKYNKGSQIVLDGTGDNLISKDYITFITASQKSCVFTNLN